jgi:uncharacterized protein with FMN-binding domain
MRKTTTVVLSSLAIALPSANAWAAAQASTANTTVKRKVVVATKSFTGNAYDADRWGPLQVTIVVRKTTTTIGLKKTVTRKITKITVPVSPNHTDRSAYISQQALPLLRQELLQLKGSSIQLVSGATDTSYAFVDAIRGALSKAGV